MAYRWSILRAAVEQEISFPSKSEYERYVKNLNDKGEVFEVGSVENTESGEVIVVMRKRYNNNLFLPKGRG